MDGNIPKATAIEENIPWMNTMFQWKQQVNRTQK